MYVILYSWVRLARLNPYMYRQKNQTTLIVIQTGLKPLVACQSLLWSLVRRKIGVLDLVYGYFVSSSAQLGCTKDFVLTLH